MTRIVAARAACLLILCTAFVAAGRCGPEAKTAKLGKNQARLAEPRRIEPQLSTPQAWCECPPLVTEGHTVPSAACDASNTPSRTVSIPIEDCRDMTRNYAQALDALSSQPDCTDAALQRLETVSGGRSDSATASDLSAAYYVRAQRRDDPVDLLRALNRADQAAKLAPALLPARFNQALALEAIGFSNEASKVWNELRRSDRSPWGREAGEHWKRLNKAALVRAATQWPLNRQRLPVAVQAGDRAAVAHLIAPYSAACESYVEHTLLPAWARAASAGNSQEAGEYLDEADMSAAELARVSGDHYLLDDLDAIRHSLHDGPAKLAALREGHTLLGEAYAEHNPQKAAPLFRRAESMLRRGGSPLHNEATLARAVAVSQQTGRLSVAIDLLLPIEREARRRGYRGLLSRIQAQRAYCLLFKSRYIEALSQYDAALRGFEQVGDLENAANIHIRNAGTLRVLGHKELAWREALEALKHEEHVVGLRSRHLIAGESAVVALELGFPSIALRLQDSAVEMIKDALAGTARGQTAAIEELRRNLAIALRGRARILPHLHRLTEARHDLNEAIGLTAGTVDPLDESTRRVLSARLKEAEGENLLASSKPRRAIAAFTDALDASSQSEFRTFRASLLVRRADAYRRAGFAAEAKVDLEAAVEVLHAEEREILEHRQRGTAEALWSLYFDRFRPAYDGLISQLVDEKHYDEAFAYAERARAFEPLSLVLQTKVAPEAFRTLSRNGETLALEQIQANLPHGTFLIEYWVSDRRTFVWIVSRERFDFVSEPVRDEQIAEWRTALHRDASEHDVESFVAALDAPYVRLLQAPLAKIELMPGGKDADRRLVVVPDRFIHGLPFPALRNPKTLRHLIEDYTVSVAGSATLFVYSELRNNSLPAKGKRPVLLVGDPAFDERLEIARNLRRLKQARNEIDGVLPLYGARAVELHDENATAERFLRLANGSVVVHFAGHIIANPAAPFHSLMLLAPSRSHSGVLSAEELMLRLRAKDTRLFVLSACSSAGGTDIGPEGLAPLVRPLVTAGVPAVIGSLWNVSDTGDSARLLVVFHSYFISGNDAARALQLAQLEVLRKSRSPHPAVQSVLVWAPFQVIGYASSPFANGNDRRESP
jgi:CHAT domain-containing protein